MPRHLGHGLAAALGGGVLVLWAAAYAGTLAAARLPAEDEGAMIAVFAPRTGFADAFAAITAAGGRPVGPVLGGWVWVVVGDGQGFAGRLAARGAITTLRTPPAVPGLAGCLPWTASPPQGADRRSAAAIPAERPCGVPDRMLGCYRSDIPVNRERSGHP